MAESIVLPRMAISRVRIENFRSIRSCELRPGALCALVGENNAGKSNILDALNLVLGRDFLNVNAFEPGDHWNHDSTNDIVIEVEFDPPLSHKPFTYADAVEIPVLRYMLTRYKKATARAPKGAPRLQTDCLSKKGEPVLVPLEAPKKGKQLQFGPLTTIPQDVREQVPLIFIGTDRSLERQLPSARFSLLKRLLDDVNEALRSTMVETTTEDGKVQRPAVDVFEEHLRAALSTLRIKEFNALEELLRRHSLENLGYDPDVDSERLRFHFGLFDSMAFYRAVRLRFQEGALDVDATEMGEGAQNALVVAIFQAYEELRKKGAVFLIEEPEMYLHPHRGRFFYRTLERIAQNNQVLYTTHSASFVSVPRFDSVRLVYRAPDNSTKVRESTLEPTPQLTERLRQAFDPTRNELFFARHIVLVEGDTERLALPEYARRLGVDLDRLGCSIVEVGGKRSLPTFLDVTASFGLPTTVVFDEDSSDFSASKKEEERAFNAELEARASDSVRAVKLEPNYEGALRRELGDELYLALTQKYPGHSKARRARLIAADREVPVPELAKRILGFSGGAGPGG